MQPLPELQVFWKFGFVYRKFRDGPL